MRGLWKWTKRVVLGLLALIIVAGLAGWGWLRSSLPELDGRIALNGPKAAIQILRDRHGVPHIYTLNRDDAYYALGYVHAQDRLFQMETMRRIGAGRLAEIAGKSALQFDKFIRTLGLYRLAERNHKALSAPVRRILASYAAGVNAFLDTRSGALPPEFQVLRFRPGPWKPADSIVWGRLMAIQLAVNWRNELLRARMIKVLGGAEKIAPLWPGDPPGSAITIPDRRQGLYDGLDLRRLWAALPRDFVSAGASNQWVIHGAQTKSGKPILANDPHLGLGAPIMWYLVHIEAPGMTLTGATVPGVPLLVIGHNGRVAWGVTTTYIDTDDLFVEKLDVKDPAKYITPTGPKPFVTRKEVIRVRGADPVTFTVRQTRHGVVISDVLREGEKAAVPKGHVLALSAPWLRADDTTAEALYDINRARDALGVVSALRKYQSPPQNFVFADVDGTVGFYAAGLIPMRKKGKGYLPSPGWTGDYDWTGFIPFDQLPRGLNPPGGVFVNANNRSVGADYPHFLSREWGDIYRAARITALLRSQKRKTVAGSMAIQKDVLSGMARDVLPLMLRVRPGDHKGQRAVRLLEAWDYRLDRRRPEGLIFFAWFAELNRRLYGDELKGMAKSYIGLRPQVVKGMLTKHTAWCDDVSTPAKENCGQQLARSLAAALATLTKRYGEDMAEWRWGDAHFAKLRHRIFDFVPVVRNFTNLTIAADGGPQTVNKAAFLGRGKRERFAARHGPGFRAVFDLANLKNSRFIIATGQSGNPLSRYYDNLLTRWRDGRYVTLGHSREDVARTGVGKLTLQPAPPGQ